MSAAMALISQDLHAMGCDPKSCRIPNCMAGYFAHWPGQSPPERAIPLADWLLDRPESYEVQLDCNLDRARRRTADGLRLRRSSGPRAFWTNNKTTMMDRWC